MQVRPHLRWKLEGFRSLRGICVRDGDSGSSIAQLRDGDVVNDGEVILLTRLPEAIGEPTLALDLHVHFKNRDGIIVSPTVPLQATEAGVRAASGSNSHASARKYRWEDIKARHVSAAAADAQLREPKWMGWRGQWKPTRRTRKRNSDGPSSQRRERCLQWSAYSCRYGASCRFSHEGPGAVLPNGHKRRRTYHKATQDNSTELVDEFRKIFESENTP